MSFIVTTVCPASVSGLENVFPNISAISWLLYAIPANTSAYILATRSGVSFSPSRSGSSPNAFKIPFTWYAMASVSIAISAASFLLFKRHVPVDPKYIYAAVIAAARRSTSAQSKTVPFPVVQLSQTPD